MISLVCWPTQWHTTQESVIAVLVVAQQIRDMFVIRPFDLVGGTMGLLSSRAKRHMSCLKPCPGICLHNQHSFCHQARTLDETLLDMLNSGTGQHATLCWS